MSYNFNITEKEKEYLRELAREYLEYANLPVMYERKKLWYSHNSLKAERPVIVVEYNTFINDIRPVLKCESEAARKIELKLQMDIINYEFIGDDKVISPYYTVDWKINIKQFGMDIRRTHAVDSRGNSLGYRFDHPVKDLEKDLPALKHSTFSVDREYTLAWKNFVEDIIGDILPVKITNSSLRWHMTPSQHVVELMGLENMMYAFIENPDEMHALYRFLTDDIMMYIEWQEKEGLLVLNNENDYTGAGSYGFTNELPDCDYKEGEPVRTKDLWGNMNSQETVGISPDMYKEFIYPYYRELAEKFGLVYYGCCEPVHDIWKDCLSELPNLRKISVSPWCNENFMGEVLRGSNVIYSRKPSPNYIGVGNHLDEDAFSDHITKTLNAAKGCELEIIFRDIYTLNGNIQKPGRAVEIVRELIDKIW